MKRLWIALAVTTAVALGGCGLPGVGTSTGTIDPDDIGLQSDDGPSVNYLIVGKPNYDKLFFDAATVRTHLLAANSSMNALEASVAKLVRDTGGFKAGDVSTWMAAIDSLGGHSFADSGNILVVDASLARVQRVIPRLTAVPGQAAALAVDAQRLLGSLNSDFPKWEKVKIPAATRELTVIGKDLAVNASSTVKRFADVPGFALSWQRLREEGQGQARVR